MPSAFSHPAVALALRLAAGREAVSGRLLALAAVCTVLPDADVIGFWLGIPYGHLLGHRGLTHSLAFAVFLGWLASLAARRLRSMPAAAFWVVTIATASHGFFDALTDGGLGVAFFSPFSNVRYFLPWQPIVVSPISIVRFFEPRSLSVLYSELLWLWLPVLACGAVVAGVRRRA